MAQVRTREGTEKRLAEALAAARPRRFRSRRTKRLSVFTRSRHHDHELRETA